MQQQLLALRKDGRYGFFDLHGNQVVPPSFSFATRSTEGFAWAVEDRRLMVFDCNGRLCFSLDNTSCYTDYSNGLLAVNTQEGMGYVDSKGQLVIEARFVLAYPFDKFGAVAKMESGGHVVTGRIGRDGRWLSQPIFEEIRMFHPQGAFAGGKVLGGTQFVIVDGRGSVVGQSRFLDVRLEHEGMIPVEFTVDEFGWVNPQGEAIVRRQLEGIGDSFDGGMIPAKQSGKYGILTRDGAWAIQPRFHFLYSPSENLIRFVQKSRAGQLKVGLIDREGNVVVPAEYTDMTEFIEGVATVYRPDPASDDPDDCLTGYIDSSGRLLCSEWT